MSDKNYARGDRLPQTKLTDKDVKQTRELVGMGFKQRDVAKHMGISPGQLSKIISGKARKSK